ncbi:hypothetical protein LX36DRAFT_586743, partial [Colletotrichum falcatum]
SLWETKSGADILLTMGANKWRLHESIIRGKSGIVDHILDITGAQSDTRKIALKDHAFTASALEATLKYFYVGDGIFDGKTEVIDLLAVYDVSVTLAVPELQQLIAPRIGNLLRDILTSRIDLFDDFIVTVEVIVSEEAETWEAMRQELQKAISPHIGMLFSRQEFTNLVRTNLSFCFETLSTAITRMDTLEKDAGEPNDPNNLRDNGDGVESMSSPGVACKHSTTCVSSSLQAVTLPPKFTIKSSTSDSMSNSDGSAHWESCSEGDITSESRVQRSRASGVSTPVTPQTGTSTSSTVSDRTIDQRSVGSRVVERTRLPYTSSRPRISQTKEPAVLSPLKRTSHGYSFTGTSVPRDFHFSGTTQTEQTKFANTRIKPKYAQDDITSRRSSRSSSRKKEARAPSPRKSGVRSMPQLDPVTARQVKKGRLIVEPANYQRSSSERFLNGPHIECNPS